MQRSYPEGILMAQPDEAERLVVQGLETRPEKSLPTSLSESLHVEKLASLVALSFRVAKSNPASLHRP